MIRYLLLLVLINLNLLSFGQADKQIKLIIRGDDIGFAHTVNRACIDSYVNGVMTSVELMVPTPWFPEAVKMLNGNPGLDVGVHLTLTSEWESVKWRPLTDASSLTDDEGYFFPMIWPNDNYGPEQALKEADWDLKEIEKEFRAQIEMALNNVPQVSHLSGHMGCSNLSPEVTELVDNLAKEYDLEVKMDHVKRAGYEGPRSTPEEKEESFIRMLENLEPGTYLFVDHPGYDTPELRAIYHIGYENVAIDREGVTRTFTSPRVKEVIEKRGIQLISYADLKEK